MNPTDDERCTNSIFSHVCAFHDGDQEPVFIGGYKRTSQVVIMME